MYLFEALLIFCWSVSIDGDFNLFLSDERWTLSPVFDCLYYHRTDRGTKEHEYRTRFHLIPYCRRSNAEDPIDDLSVVQGQPIPFNTLYEERIMTEDLLSWSAPIDVAERYERHRLTGSTEIFYNCSLPWFGSHCQYRFEEEDAVSSFNQIVEATFAARHTKCFADDLGSCYRFLPTCTQGTSALCLDWREICDGKNDCFNGEDEEHCEELELNECAANEYRCHFGGQCIPLEFMDEGISNIDCLDGSDEGTEDKIHLESWWAVIDLQACPANPLFQCEERICRYPRTFACGDGDCDAPLKDKLGRFRCGNGRLNRLYRGVFDSSFTCQQTLLCLIGFPLNFTYYCSLLNNRPFPIRHCPQLASECHNQSVAIPDQPVLFGFFQFIYFTNRSCDDFEVDILPDLICFNAERCPGLLNYTAPTHLNNGLTCFHRNDVFGPIVNGKIISFMQLDILFQPLVQRCLTVGREYSCLNSSLFHCSESMKCISYHRVFDGVRDCFYGEDESYAACSLNQSNRFICLFNPEKCLAHIAFNNGVLDCPLFDDEPFYYRQLFGNQPRYRDYCNGAFDLSGISPILNDESDCDYWPCNTPYLRCDNRWHCPNGIDELHCPDNQCGKDAHMCVKKDFQNFICLPFNDLYDEIFVNCSSSSWYVIRTVYFDNRTGENNNQSFAWKKDRCIQRHKLCQSETQPLIDDDTLCQNLDHNLMSIRSNIKTYDGHELCVRFRMGAEKIKSMFFLTDGLGFYPATSIPTRTETLSKSATILYRKYTIAPHLNIYCQRGIFLRFGPNGTKKCLCPPSSFGDRCQWQAQRVSLTLQIIHRSFMTQMHVFQVILMLIDEDGQMAPHVEQFTFSPIRDCGIKYNLYLLYPDRPKNVSKIYSVRIDVFDRLTLKHHVSWHLSIPYAFLPVNRIAAQLIIPEQMETKNCLLSCGSHGRCQHYGNKPTLFYCQCDPGYSGLRCEQHHSCMCADASQCHASSMCICPLHYYGRYCLLQHSICRQTMNICQNRGLCVSDDARWPSKKFICLCPEGYTGDRCEKITNKIEVHIDHHLLTADSWLAFHSITAYNDQRHDRITLFKKIPLDRDAVTLFLVQPFHIIIAELLNGTYYLVVVRENYIPSEQILTRIDSGHRCLSIGELGNSTWVNSPLLYRGKFYPMLCRKNLRLSCFYDEIHICLCDIDRFANCFEFNHSMTYNCHNWNMCENNGQCLVRNATCPTRIACICPDCYYGTRCQFSTQGYVLSLDSILGYHIKPDVSVREQSIYVKVTLMISICILILGSISGVLSMITFASKESREFGCGWYLLASSILSLCTVFLLTAKIWHLIASQMNFIENRILLHIHCLFVDTGLRILFSTCDWLNACVAIERLVTVRQETRFDRKKNRKLAKRIIVIVILVTLVSHIQDPLNRKLADDFDVDEKRTWCLVKYSAVVDRVNTIIVFSHLLTPFIINLTCVILMIGSRARTRSVLLVNKSFVQHLTFQLHHYQHLLMTPALLVLLSLPRLIIPFFTGCMKTPRNPALFLTGYFVSYLPAILSFPILVLSSSKYRSSFFKAVQSIQRRVSAKFLS